MYAREKLSGSGREDNDIAIPGVTVERQKKETKWMLTLQTVYPYGLNDRVGDEYMAEKDSRVVGNKFLYKFLLLIASSIRTSRVQLL